MNFKKVAKPGKIMKQPPKDPNSGKMDSQIFIGKEDPQHASKKKKKKKEEKKSSTEETLIKEAKLDEEWKNIEKLGFNDKQLVDLFVDFAEETGGTYEGLYKGSPKDYVPQINMLNRAVLLTMPTRDESTGNETPASPNDIKKSAELISIALKGIEQVEEGFLTASKKKDKKGKKKKEWGPNPWAVCHTTVDKDKDPEKFERCVQEVKKKQAFNLNKFVKKADTTSVLNELSNRLKNVRIIQDGVLKIEESLKNNPNEVPQMLIDMIKPKIKEILDSIPDINSKMKQAASEEMSEESAESLRLLQEQLTGFNGLLQKIQTFPQAIQTELLGNVQDINRNFQNMQQNMGAFRQPKKHPLVATYDFLYDLLGQWWTDLPKLGKSY